MLITVNVQGISFEVELEDIQARPIRAVIDGETFEVWPEENFEPAPDSTPRPSHVDHPAAPAAEQAPDAPSGTHSVQSHLVKAPIPGVIVAVAVKPGDAVQYGQELCVLEAMKMKNSIRANRDGIVREVPARLNEAVRQGQVLIQFEEDD